MFGFLCVNKRRGESSSHVVAIVKRLIRSPKVGHAGTLDPLATGVLMLCLGPATRLTRFIQEKTKSYIGDFRLGQTSRSDDTECELETVRNAPLISGQHLLDTLPEFTGDILQKPPQFSAIKIGGKPAYRLARQGNQVDLRKRRIHVNSIELLEFDYPNFKLAIVCGSGTYIRSLGRDIGLRLSSGAVMTGLVRTAIGRFKLQDAISSDELSYNSIAQGLRPPMEAFDHLPSVSLTPPLIWDIAHGAILPAHQMAIDPKADTIVAVDDRRNLVALLTRLDGDKFKPTINFAQHYL